MAKEEASSININLIFRPKKQRIPLIARPIFAPMILGINYPTASIDRKIVCAARCGCAIPQLFDRFVLRREGTMTRPVNTNNNTDAPAAPSSTPQHPPITNVHIGPDNTRGQDPSAAPPVPRPDVVNKDRNS